MEKDAFTDESMPEFEVRTVGGMAERVKLLLETADGRQVWKSAELPGRGPFFAYTGDPLAPKTDYLLQVTAWQGNQEAHGALRFATGFLGTAWEGKWIEPVQEPAIPEERIHFWQNFIPWPIPEPEQDGEKLRCGQTLWRVIDLDEVPAKAVLYATARGVYTLWLNGRRVTDTRLAPGSTPYDKLLYYQRYDLTGLLNAGRNKLVVELGDGWYAGHVGLASGNCQYGDRLSFLCQLELTGADGNVKIIGSDEKFECRSSTIAYSDLMIGEKWDLTHAGHPWSPCCLAEPYRARLTAQPIPSVAPQDTLNGKLFRTPNGELLADFGQAVAGVVRLCFSCKETVTVILDHTEVLDRDGNFHRNIIGRCKQQRDQIVCPPGTYTFEPLHTYHGFRYARITGLKEEEIDSIQAVVLGTPLDFAASFRCSEPALNQLQHNIRWSMKSNFVSVPTDCPQREKLGWTGDMQVFTRTGVFNADLLGFLSAWLSQVRLEQFSDGGVPNFVPNLPIEDVMAKENGGNTSSAWGDVCILLPLALYDMTGNTTVLWDNLDMMEKWLDFVDRAARSEGDPLLWTSGHHFGDWLIPSLAGSQDGIGEGVMRTVRGIASGFRAVSLEGYLQVLDILLNEKDDAELRDKRTEAAKLLDRVREAVRTAFVSPEGMVEGDMQGLYVIMLRSGAVTGELRQKVADRLAKMIEANGTALDTGFVTTPYLLDVLMENGHEDLAWKLLYRDEAPSWLYQVKMGATTIWENWTAMAPGGQPMDSSMNHYALGAVGDWMYRHIGGIYMTESGWKRVTFSPDLNCGLDWCECSRETPFGPVSCRWERSGQTIIFTLKAPVPAELDFCGRHISLQPGEHHYTLSDVVPFAV